MEVVCECLEFFVEKMFKIVYKYGNIFVVFILIFFVEELEVGKIKDGDVVVMVGFGGGLIWGVIVICWG